MVGSRFTCSPRLRGVGLRLHAGGLFLLPVRDPIAGVDKVSSTVYIGDIGNKPMEVTMATPQEAQLFAVTFTPPADDGDPVGADMRATAADSVTCLVTDMLDAMIGVQIGHLDPAEVGQVVTTYTKLLTQENRMTDAKACAAGDLINALRAARADARPALRDLDDAAQQVVGGWGPES